MKGFSDFDSFLFHEGTNYESYKKLGAHLDKEDGIEGTRFAVYAPNARSVNVITEQTWWDESKGGMERHDNGMWEVFMPYVKEGDKYRYVIVGADGVKRYKLDPYEFYSEVRPNNASIVYGLDNYKWHDKKYMKNVDSNEVLNRSMAIYEVHLGSWKKKGSGESAEYLNYRILADELVKYLTYMGYTHVELMGICEYPFDPSWGYQVTGYFAPTSRYGNPDDFRYMVDVLHQAGIGVIIDWVPAHFPKDSFALEHFDGTCLFESDDPLKAEYPEWGTYAFDHTKPEVRSFLISSAFYWIKEFHADALRVDAVAAMLYASFSREKWRPNMFGGNENLESKDFLKQLNYAIRHQTHGYLIAEDSSALPGITTPVEQGGVGFLLKWNMGWMNDTLRYFEKETIYRQYEHELITHSLDYAFTENFILVLSHDEVVYGKKPMLLKNPGSMPEKSGGLKVLYTYQFTHPGKKLLFMGQEFGEDREWDENREINWWLTDDFGRRDIMHCVRNLIRVYKERPVLFADSMDRRTFEWVNRNDYSRNTVSYIRRNPWNYNSAVLVILNFSPMEYTYYKCGVPVSGYYKRAFSTYDSLPGGGGPDEVGDIPPISPYRAECDGRLYTLEYNLRPFEGVIFDFPIIEDN
ncbi:MAG: 1,4-alpha-glucan branching protein GlgB [Lachnospiraceae bacterium]|nr:1,4-alpha-glucan branching protein GlgB [Lachnospiraceae bacterium]